VELSLVGPTNRLQARTADPSRSVNWFPYAIQTPGQKSRTAFAPTSGLTPRWTFGDGPNVCLFYQDGRFWGINGTVVAELYQDYTYDIRGSVLYDPSYRATMCSNGTAGFQALITAGGGGSILNLTTHALTPIADPDFPAHVVMGEFFLGYFVVLVLNSRQFWWSALEDGTSWDALDTAQRSWGSDNISFIKRINTQLWIGGTQTSEVWYATGGTDVFAPIQGALLDFGCIANFSATRHDNTIAWLSQDPRGGGQVIIAKGYNPEAISTYAIDRQIQLAAGALNSTIGLAMQEQGHTFLWMVPGFNNTTADTTPVLDSKEGQWHERALWDTTKCVWLPHVGNTHAYAFEKHFVGDRRTGAIYELSPDVYGDQVVTP
jgi:hypothetical protein